MSVLLRPVHFVVHCALLAALVSTIPSAHAQTAAQKSAPDTRIVIGVTDFPRTLDPGEAYDFATWEVLSHLYTGLTRQIPGTYDYELALAEAVQISDDKLTYTFTLRAGAAFADGTPITAQTFVDSITRVLVLRTDATQAIEPYLASVTTTEAGDLTFTLTRPVPYFLALVSLPPYFAQHPDLARTDRPQAFSPIALHAAQSGNGPYVLADFTVQREMVLRANPAYQHGAQPETPTIILRRYARSQDLRDAIRAHAVDMAWRGLYTGHLIELADDQPDGLTIIEQPGTRVFYLYFNQNRAPFDDPSTREAITLLVERDDLTAHDHISALTSLVPPEFPDAYAPIWPDDFALEQAEQVLYAAGYRTRGQSLLQFDVIYSLQTYGLAHVGTVTRLVRQEFNKSAYISAGLFTDIETAAMITQIERGETGPAMVFAWTPIVPHPAAYLRPLAHQGEPIPSNGGYATPVITRLLDEAALLDDPGAQGVLYRDVADHLLADYALVPLFQDHVTLVAWADIGGIQVEGNMFLHFDRLVRE